MTTHGPLADRRVLVVGASSGIGAAFARASVTDGATVVVSARRRERLLEVVAEAGGGTVVAGDATSPEDMRRVAVEAVDAMGGIDLMLYAAGYGVLQRMVDTDPDTWLGVYRVNVIGANLATAAVLDHMDRDGVIAFISSRTAEDANALFTTYSASKAALDQCIRAWRVEHPDRRFVRVVMGNTQPTEFPHHMGTDLLAEAIDTWAAQAIPGGMMHVDDVGRALASSLAVALDHPEIDSSELKLDARTV